MSSAVNSTYKLVRKADTAGDTSVRPSICSTKPNHRNSPSQKPPFHAARSFQAKRAFFHDASSSPAKAKRNPMNHAVPASSTPSPSSSRVRFWVSFIHTKVPPQASVTKNSAATGIQRGTGELAAMGATSIAC